ncbi:citrate lyase holo-[acyl-carrier protein] synthase [Geobacter sp. FeAm09]|uniref:citrate lyase holo-[acyl-carrier protein] synthase n=1 Tax=Geobacter sp. FeAm09 TaxID=2597769 RepID=UPI00143DBABB|nr:citrate lyase holo-[acyl-carrier protein] synthase [Geobacter sp. FeAm09]
MSSEKLHNDLLAARDRRQELLAGCLDHGYPATICLSLNIPGPDKSLPGGQGLFAWALRSLAGAFPGWRMQRQPDDLLGPWGIMPLDLEAPEVKQRCMAVETAHPCGRLLDLDVYDARARQVDRASLALPPRPCLVCGQAAGECIRLGRHAMQEIRERTDELLAHFRY